MRIYAVYHRKPSIEDRPRAMRHELMRMMVVPTGRQPSGGVLGTYFCGGAAGVEAC